MSNIRAITSISLTLLLISGFAACERGDSEAPDDGDEIAPIDFDSDNAIGVGWIRYEEPYTGTTTVALNLRSAPTVNSEIVKAVAEGTELKLTGISVAGSIVMAWDEYVKTLPSDYFPPPDEPSTGVYVMPSGWFRVEYEGEPAWAHSALVEVSGEFVYMFNGPPYYIDDYAEGCVAPIYDVLTFDSDGALKYAEVLDFDDPRMKSVTPYPSGYSREPYYGENPREPVYDLRICTPPAYELYMKKESGASFPDWYKDLPPGTMVGDYVEIDNGVWISDIASGCVVLLDTNGAVKTEFDKLALPVYLCGDGAGGVWAADPYAELTVHLNEKGEPVHKIEGFETRAMFYDGETGLAWLHGKYEGEAQLWLLDSSGEVKSRFDSYSNIPVKSYGDEEVRDFHLHYENGLRRAVFRRAADGLIMIYRLTQDLGC